MQNITIKKASIKDGSYLNVEYSEQQPDGFSTIKKECKITIHSDLKISFRELDEHLAYLSFMRNDKGTIDITTVSCKGFSIGGSGDSEGVTLIGTRVLESDKTLNINSPFQKFSDDYYEYPRMDELAESLEKCKHEVYAYLFEGKHEEDNQMSLPFEELEEVNS